MPLNRTQKQNIVKELKIKITQQKVIIFVNFKGLKVKNILELRRKLKAIGDELKVVKKTLLKLVIKEEGINFDIKKLKGEIALIFGYKDEISPAQIIYQFARKNPNLKILSGYLNNETKEAEEIINLAKLPPRKELLTKLVGTINAPILNLTNVLGINIKKLIYILRGIKS